MMLDNENFKLALSSALHKTDVSGSILFGDCLELLPLFADKSVDHSFTSPPYNRKRNDKYRDFTDINENWLQLNIDVLNQLLRVTKKHIFYNIQANYYNRQDVYELIGLFSKSIVDIHIWEKSNPMPASGKNITNAVEYFLVLGNESLKSNATYTKNIITTSVNSTMPKEHKAVMKTDVAEHFISKFTNENDIILDCFFGYGTTGVVAKKLNRRYIGIEKEKLYYEMSVKRCDL
jgi:site-specific DNA-methyltransferase (adenine-specific)